jgi:hypothetical protein
MSTLLGLLTMSGRAPLNGSNYFIIVRNAKLVGWDRRQPQSRTSTGSVGELAALLRVQSRLIGFSTNLRRAEPLREIDEYANTDNIH